VAIRGGEGNTYVHTACDAIVRPPRTRARVFTKEGTCADAGAIKRASLRSLGLVLHCFVGVGVTCVLSVWLWVIEGLCLPSMFRAGRRTERDNGSGMEAEAVGMR
jgi:hypothetical protein